MSRYHTFYEALIAFFVTIRLSAFVKLGFSQRNEAELLRQFREDKSQEAGMKHVLSTIRKCQSVCRQMDERCGINVPCQPWYWPPQISQDEPDSGEEKEVGLP